MHTGTSEQVATSLAHYGICGSHISQYIDGAYDLPPYWHAWVKHRLSLEYDYMSILHDRKYGIVD
jgi:hypothetical protein